MPRGVYKRTKHHIRMLRINASKAHQSGAAWYTPKRIRAARRQARIIAALPRTEKQLASLEKGRIASLRAQKRKNGFCEICGCHCKIQKDHDHKTGKRRGNICFGCNSILGLAKDSIRRLRKVIRYLKKHRMGASTLETRHAA